MKSFSWTLALRYLNPLRAFVSIITLLSLIGVSFGVMVLIVVLSVHNGFERNLKDTLLGHSPHLSVYSSYGPMADWQAREADLATLDGVESAYALVEGFVLLDSKRWQRPAYFRAFNTENQGQLDALENMLDDRFPGGSVDFNPPLPESAGAAPDLDAAPDFDAPPEDASSVRLPDLQDEKLYADRYAVISSQLADAIGVGVGDEIRIIAASNLEAVMEVYRVPSQSAWELYPEDFLAVQDAVTEIFDEKSGQERAEIGQVAAVIDQLKTLVPIEVTQVDGSVAMTEGRDMRKVEQNKIYEMIRALEGKTTQKGEWLIYERGTQQELLKILTELREIDLEKADNEAFREIESFVVPKELRIQGVYADSERSKGPDLFIPISVGMDLKGLQGAVESIGLRIPDPYQAEQAAARLQGELGEDVMVQSWMRTHSDRFALVKTEKIMMSFALSFITLLSAFSIMAVMYTVTVQKRQEIGVMKALGARPSQIVRVFVYQGLVVGVGGAFLGVGLGLLAIRYREGIMAVIRSFGVDPFPAEFHGMSELPAEMVWGQLGVITVIAVILCLLAALIPALMAAFRDPAKSLRNL